MNPPSVHIVDMEGLAELLEEIMSEDKICSIEEAKKRFTHACRVAYDVTRNGLDIEKPRVGDLIGQAHHNTVNADGVMAAAGCLIMEAACQYLAIEQKRDPERFRKQFIFCMDSAVQDAGEGMKESHEARTKQSAKERAAQSSSTS